MFVAPTCGRLAACNDFLEIHLPVRFDPRREANTGYELIDQFMTIRRPDWVSAILALAFWCVQLNAQGPETAQPSPASANTLTLKKAVELALQNSRDVTIARVQYQIASNDARVDRSEFHPNLYTGSGLAYTSGFPSTPGGQAPSIFNLSYNQAIFNPALRGNLKAAEERAESQRIELERTRDDVMVRTASAYLELAKVEHSLDLLRTESESQQKILGMVRERAAAGLELPIEITRSELGLARIRQKTIQLEGRDRILNGQLKDELGLGTAESLEVEQVELPDVQQPESSVLESLAISQSPLIREAEKERQAREEIWKGQRGSYWPSVSLIGQYAILSRFNNYSEFYKTFERNNVTVGLEVQIPIFSAKTGANIALAKSQFQAADLQVGKNREIVRLDVQQRMQTMRELDASKEVARLDLQLAQETLGVVQEKYDQGRAEIAELQKARIDENDKWLAYLDADFAREKEELNILEKTGQLSQLFQ